MTGYHDYLIILVPPDNIVNYVKSLKKYSAGIIGGFESLHAKGHITVQPLPRQKPLWIEPLIPKLERELQTLPPLEADINGFAYFDQQDTQTIYAKLATTPQNKLWFKLLRKFFSANAFEPHITITRSIPNADFKKLWPYFKDKPFNAKMTIDHLTILRREMIGHDRSYRVFKEIPFNHRLNFNDFTNAKLKAATPAVGKVDTQQISLF
jgi:2'-5' RNA ligase